MRPAAVCNHPGPRRAAREAAGESARWGVDSGCLPGQEIRLAAAGVRPGRACPPNARPSVFGTIIIPLLQVRKGPVGRGPVARRSELTGAKLTLE